MIRRGFAFAEVSAWRACAFLFALVRLGHSTREESMHHRVSTLDRLVSAVPARVRLAFAALIVSAVIPLAAYAQAQAQAQAQVGPSDKAVIEYRQLVMGAVGSNMGAIGGILKNQLALPGAIAIHAQQMAESAKLMGPAFKQKVTVGKTDAKPKIWSDWAKFEQAIADYEKAATKLAAAAKGSDAAATGAAVKALGESCGGCHDDFRKPKEQSYKNR
jgi:cytochrome c556